MNLWLRERRVSALNPGLFGQRDSRTTLIRGASESLGSLGSTGLDDCPGPGPGLKRSPVESRVSLFYA
jgi:hypothetical protein